MLILTSRTPWRRRPSGLVTLNRDSPLAVGLAMTADWHPGQQDVQPNGVRAFVGHAAVSPDSEYGWVLRCDGAGDYAEYSSTVDRWGGKYVSVAAWVLPLAAGTSFPRIIDRVYNGQFAIYRTESVSTLGMAGNYATGATDVASVSNNSAFPLDVWTHIVASYDGANITVYVNGVVDKVTAINFGALDAYSTNTRFGQRVDGSNRDWEGAIGPVYVWDRPLSPAEVWSLYDPATRWSLYAPLVRRVYVDLGAAPSGFNPAWARRTSLIIGTGLR